jgi:hypothetical protein
MKKLLIPILSTLIFFTSTSLASNEVEPYSKERCVEIYRMINVPLRMAIVDYELQNDEDLLFWSTVAANFATIYETVCKD